MHEGNEKATAKGGRRIFSIPAGAHFLRTLARSLVNGELVDGFVPRNDPLLLPSATIYLPTRRSARALAGELVEAMGAKACLLPQIRALGDPDDDFGETAPESADATLPRAIGDMERQLILSELVRGWTTEMSRNVRDLLGEEDIAIPSSTSEAIRLSGELARLLDSFATEEVSLADLDGLVGPDAIEGRPQRWAEWWNLTLHFVSILRKAWPAILKERGALDPAERRRQVIDRRRMRLAERGSTGPVIAAGSTGSIPATARLIGEIAAMHNGAVVLPGLDHDLPETVWNLLALPDAQDETLSLCTHPQYGLARLLRSLGAGRDDVRPIGESLFPERNRTISAAMMPAVWTGLWAKRKQNPAAISGMALVEAPNERQEALAIAIAMRETLETTHGTTFLVTPDRMLAMRVSAELGRFGIRVEDSAGTPLPATAPAQLARLVLSSVLESDAATLASLLKNAFVAGEPKSAGARTARLYELAVLRGAITMPGPGKLEGAAAAMREIVAANPFAPDEVLSMSEADWDAVIGLGKRIDDVTFSIRRLLAGGERIRIEDLVGTLRVALSLVVLPAQRAQFEASQGAAELERFFDSIVAGDADSFDFPGEECVDLLDALMSAQTVGDRGERHERLAIFGLLEARLQQADRVILAGLNEGTWPAAMRNDAFLSRQMRAELGLSTPERRIGQSAHDFQQLCGHAEVILTRSLRSGNAPTVASRWLQRLAVVAGKEAVTAMRKDGGRYLSMADRIDAAQGRPGRASRPNPKPPVERRPNSLSVTEIETWIRDPYAIHARHVLGIRPLPPLERPVDAMIRGQIYHEILARFVAGDGGHAAPEARLAEIAEESFARWQLPPELQATWIPRFMAVGRLFLSWNGERMDSVASSHCEVRGRIEVADTGFILRGRADRIDVFNDGSWAILDYKTGQNPSMPQARTLSPQLALEANMAVRGGFAVGKTEAGPTRIAELAYVRLVAGDALKIEGPCDAKDAPTAEALMKRAWDELLSLVEGFRDPRRGYPSRSAPAREGDVGGDYDHLARVREWSAGEGEEADD
jgi:ATP-dependent helicase/nuclease subunit B